MITKINKKKRFWENKKKEDYGDEYKNFSLDSSFEKSDDNKSSLDQASSDKEK